MNAAAPLTDSSQTSTNDTAPSGALNQEATTTPPPPEPFSALNNNDSSPGDSFPPSNSTDVQTPFMSNAFASSTEADNNNSSLFDNLDSDPYYNRENDNPTATDNSILSPPPAPPSAFAAVPEAAPAAPTEETSLYSDSTPAFQQPVFTPPPPPPPPLPQPESSSEPGFLSRWWSSLPSTSAIMATTETTTEIMPWKAVFFSLLIFLLISYIFRIDWNFLLDWLFTYVTVLTKSIYQSLISAKKETDEKKGKKKDSDKEEDQKDEKDAPEVEFQTTSGFATLQPTVKVSSPFVSADKHRELFNNGSGSNPKPANTIGNQFCLVGELKNKQRACVLVDSPQECMSNSLFPSKLDCLQNENELPATKNNEA